MNIHFGAPKNASITLQQKSTGYYQKDSDLPNKQWIDRPNTSENSIKKMYGISIFNMFIGIMTWKYLGTKYYDN